MAEVIPGTTWKGTPWAARSSSSSPPRPKRKGSPPFSRTTVWPARASSRRMRSISSWLLVWRLARLPTLMHRAAGGIMASTSSPTRAS